MAYVFGNLDVWMYCVPKMENKNTQKKSTTHPTYNIIELLRSPTQGFWKRQQLLYKTPLVMKKIAHTSSLLETQAAATLWVASWQTD